MYTCMNSTEINTSNRSTTVNTPGHSTVFTTANRWTTVNASDHSGVFYALAIIGFAALVGAGMWLAVYSTRYVPGVVNRVGVAAVYLGSVFNRTPASLSVVPTASSTFISFGSASSTISTSAAAHVTPVHPGTIPTTAGTMTDGAYQIGGASATAALSGLPDFSVSIDAIGYLASSSADSFVQSSTVPSGSRPAVRFTIKNIGTNVSGSWRFSASIPTQTAYIYQSQPQQSLAPGDSIDYTLGFDQANKGAGQTISITANFDHAVAESNPDNDSAAAQITILGN
jgi:CARDB